MSILESFHKRRDSGNNKVMEQEFLPYKRFYNLDSNAYSEGAVPAKYKELIGLACSLTLRCNDCIVYHVEKCIECGASREEINEAMNIGLIIGGTIVIPHLRHALEALEELLTTK